MISGAADVLFDELDDAWDAVTFDDLYTPGSYWINPPSPRTGGPEQVGPDPASLHSAAGHVRAAGIVL